MLPPDAPLPDPKAFLWAGRVNNNRAINVDSDNPDQRSSFGFGRVRMEENDLRAIATPIGAGIRETPSTTCSRA